jgi:hypothetical protein
MLSLNKYFDGGSEIQPGVKKSQKREIQISRVTKILYLVQKKILSVVFISNGSLFTIIQQTHSKTCYKFYE